MPDGKLIDANLKEQATRAVLDPNVGNTDISETAKPVLTPEQSVEAARKQTELESTLIPGTLSEEAQAEKQKKVTS